MRVYCTRPRFSDDSPHWNEVPDELIRAGDDEASKRQRANQRCYVCNMPLILRDRYVPIQEIGQGGFGRTFLALDRDFLDRETKRVIKLFRSERFLLPAQLETAKRGFENERNILDQLNHPQVPRVYASITLVADPPPRPPDPNQSDSDQASLESTQERLSFFYLVQAYVDGQDLQKELQQRQNQPFSEDEVVDLLKQILGTLQYIHTREEPVIHRDIKPSNIVRSKRDGRYHLVDFGTVKQVIQTTATNHPETQVYTKEFSPPEQHSGTGTYPSSDLYSLAATCVCLLAGEDRSGVPYDRKKLANCAISEHLAKILGRMLAPEPSDRYQSAEEVLKALESPLPPPPPPLPKWAAIALAAIVAIAGISTLLYQIIDPGDSPTPTPTADSTSPLPPPPPAAIAERFSTGENLLIPSVTTPAKEAGIAAVKAGNFSEAIERFEASLAQTPNDPETRIYLNNARLRAADRPTFKIAVSVPIGGNQGIAEEILRGVAQAQEELNQSGGINQAGLEVQIINDDNSPEIAKQVAEILVQDDQVLAVIGHNTSDVSLAAASTYQASGLVMISPTTFDEKVAEAGDYIFRAMPPSQPMAEALVDQMIAEQPDQPLKTLMCYPTAVTDQAIFKEAFEEFLTDKGGEVIDDLCDLSSGTFNPYNAIKTAIEEYGANSVYLGADVSNLSVAVTLANANKDNGDLPLFGNPTLYTREIIDYGEQVDGQSVVENLVVVTPWSPERYLDFAGKAESLWGGARVNWRTATAFDSTRAIIAGLERSETKDRSSLQATLQSRDFSAPGSSSGDPVTFSDRNRVLNPIIVQVESDGAGGFVYRPVEDMQ